MTLPQLPATNRAVVTQATTPASVKVVDWPLRLSDTGANQLPPREVLIKVHAAAINPTDWKHALGGWSDPGLVGGCDAAGEVIAVGDEVSSLKVGDRIAGFLYGTSSANNGAFAEYARYKEWATLKLPEGQSYAAGAALGIPLLTAVQALYLRQGLTVPSQAKPTGKHILIWGGTTAVGHHAIQLSKLSGLSPIVTASKQHHDVLRQLGADVLVDYKDEDVIEQIQKASGGAIPFALDCVAENGTTGQILQALGDENKGAHVVTLLPIGEEDAKTAEKAGIKAEFTLLYTILGEALKFAKAIDFPAKPEDVERIDKWRTNEWPRLAAGWSDASNGSKLYKGAKLTERGHLDDM
ncbi:Zinc-binding oxidoreductase [Ceraceosorus bombacis]|uniref:Zinc-binding oxidoreductase n=1 Tax=Ceraceosorus bombacis TaxID=401625 RepID=A0A0P1BLI0_9BASI|nr:Zinc-binding oxidoreductase [Ceraceosorus bombacis]